MPLCSIKQQLWMVMSAANRLLFESISTILIIIFQRLYISVHSDIILTGDWHILSISYHTIGNWHSHNVDVILIHSDRWKKMSLNQPNVGQEDQHKFIPIDWQTWPLAISPGFPPKMWKRIPDFRWPFSKSDIFNIR